VTESWRINDDTAFVVSDPERVVLLNLAVIAAQPIALLGTGAAVWRALVGEPDDLRPWVAEAQLLEQLAAGYETEAALIEPDVTTLLRRLAAEGYLSSRPEQALPAEPPQP
jgi:hypothetical protein